MIDGFSLGGAYTPLKLQQQIDSGLLLCSSIYRQYNDQKTGKSKHCEYKKHEDKESSLTIKIYPNGRYKVNGSFHKCKNHGFQNYDIFYLSEFTQVLSKLRDKYGFDFSNIEIRSIEFGVNIKLPFDPWYFIKSVVWLGKGRIKMNDLGLIIDLNEYEIKIYSKHDQSLLRKKMSLFLKLSIS